MTDELTPAQDANLSKLGQRTVGFLTQVLGPDGKYFLTPAGSGTIVSIKGVVFMVTAGHVARAVMDASLAGIYGVVSPQRRLRPVQFDPRLCDAVILWDGTHTAEGPDIAAIKLPPDATASIEQTRIVYNLDRRAGMKDTKPMEDLILAGFPSAATAYNVAIEDWQRHDMMTLSVVGGSRSAAILDERGYDRFEFEGIYTSGPPPSTFRGVSGGGLWCLDSDKADTVPMLYGIAYYEGGPMEDGNRKLTCAGTETLYAKLLQQAAEKWVP